MPSRIVDLKVRTKQTAQSGTRIRTNPRSSGARRRKQVPPPGEAVRPSQALSVLRFLAILSVNLAILNVLPIPVLDGGHLFFLAIEAVRRRPVSDNVQIAAQYVGLLLLLALMVFVTVKDIGRL